MVYTTDKYQSRGELGELFLHGILVDFFNAEPAVSKIYFLDSPNETAKGFDSVHVSLDDDSELILWLGEAKLYTSLIPAVKAAAESLTQHSSNEFLRKEFLAVTNKLDAQWPHYEELRDLLDRNTSLDEIVDRIILPVLIAYKSETIPKYSRVVDSYERELVDEALAARDYLARSLPDPFPPVTVCAILLPLEDTDTVRDLCDKHLRTYQSL